mmetsp:Transcript_9825/g.17855  ORF Transcript_9825/g.17855 Transcript_9825/m.17855 type:complete len:920 (-) Transcript_9825:48-2807(-)
MIKGPKAILSSAIANALGEYFVVDPQTIESNLLKDAKIVLRHVKLKEKVTHIPINSAGKSTCITITGHVDEVSYTWSWSVGRREVMWVNDAVLTIVGAKFQAKFDHKERIAVEDDDDCNTAPNTTDGNGTLGKSSFVNPETIDAASAKKIKEQKGGLGGFVARQVKMAMDMLTLEMVDFELRIVMPHNPLPPLQQWEAEDGDSNDDFGVSSTTACNNVLVVGIDKIELLSFGREGGQDDLAVVGDVPSKLKQKINLHSFACGIHRERKESDETIVSYPLVDSFSYSADVTRLGERFGGFLTGMVVLGLGQSDADIVCPDLAALPKSGLSIHMGNTQVETLMQLSVMVLAPPDENATSLDANEILEELSSESGSDHVSATSDPSSFTIPLSSASLILFEDKRFVVSDINMRYKADGTVCMLEAANMEYDSDDKSRAAASRIVITMRPAMKMTIGCTESLYIADTVLLSNPIKSSEFSYQGNTLRVRLDDELNVVTYSKKPSQEDNTPQASSPVISAPNLPCNIDLCIHKGIQLKKSDDGSLTKFGKFHFYALKEEKSTKIAIQFESVRNYLLEATTVSVCGVLPLDQVDAIDDFIFDAGDVKIMSGHSTDEWSEAFKPREQQNVKQSTKSTTKGATSSKQNPTPVIKLPFANIADLNVVIGLEASHKVGRVKDTSLVIKSFKGKAETTSKDLMNYYTKACLSRAPDFISNAEVLGLNIVDSTTGLWATWAGSGLGLGSAFGAGTGVAGKGFRSCVLCCLFLVILIRLIALLHLAITAFDAIKGAVDAGKRSRNVNEGAEWKPGDFMRGLVQAAGEATRDGVVKRGKQGDGNIIDWTVGATSNTAEYVVENKNRLGAAGAGGGGFLLGMALGGPIGAVVGGLLATATTGVALETIDEKEKEFLIGDSKGNSRKKKKDNLFR